MQLLAERSHKFAIGRRLRPDQIYRPAQAVVLEGEQDRADDIGERYPTPVLAAIADSSAQAEFEGNEHGLERAAIVSQHQADAKVDDANSGFVRRICRRLPCLADVGQIPFASRTCFGEHLVTTIAVIADCRSGDEYARLMAPAKGLGSRMRQRASALYTAVASFLFELLRPVAGDALARQMHDGIAAREFAGIEWRGRVPPHFAFARCAPNERDRLVSCLKQSRTQCPSDQS